MKIGSETLVIVLAVALVAGLYGASTAENAAQNRSPRTSSGARPMSPAPLKPRAEKIRERMNHAPSPERGRNPFVYGARRPTHAASQLDGARQAEAAEGAAVALPVPAAPPLPVFRLSGIATDSKDGTTTLTAILNDNGSLVFVKAGDKLSNGYSVVRVEETSVTLIDATGITQTIRLP